MDDFNVVAGSIGTAWEEAVHLIMSQTGLPIVDTSTAGATIEVENAVIRVADPTSAPTVSDRYPFAEMIEDYGSVLERPRARRNRDMLTVADRIYRWPASTGRTVDQMRRVADELGRDPTSRRAIVQIWNPTEDLAVGPSSNPSGHCLAQFMVREDALQMTVFGRSVDAWNAALPNMLAFAGLQKGLAGKLGVDIGTYTHFIVSLHIYVRDLPQVIVAFEDWVSL